MKKWLGYGILCLLIPAVVLGGALIFRDRQYAYITLCVAVLSCLPFFLHFERSESDVKRLILIAVMVALSVAGRMLFAPLQYFGSEAGFLTGALSAVLSNFYFGQGPWTPFQMFSWGMIGFFSGLLAPLLRRSRIALCIWGGIGGVLYSFLMDIWTVLWADGYFNLPRYFAAIASAVPVTAVYVVSNILFLLVLAKPIGKLLARMKTKYAL